MHGEKDFDPNDSASRADAMGTTGSENLAAAASSKPASTEGVASSEPCSTSLKPLTVRVTLGPNGDIERNPADRQDDQMPLFLRAILESDGATSSALHEAQASLVSIQLRSFSFVQCINCVHLLHAVCSPSSII